MYYLFRFLGWRHLKNKSFRTLLNILGIAFGIALFVAIEMINRSALKVFKENVESLAGKAKILISAGETGFLEEKIQVIKKIPGVQFAVPMIESRGYFEDKRGQNSETRKSGETRETKTETLLILGIDLLQEQAVRSYKTTDQEVIDDPLVFLNQTDSIILTHAFAKAHDLKIESKINLSTVQGTKIFTVRGLLSPEGPAKAFGGAIAIMDIDAARFVFGKQKKVDRVDIVPVQGVNIPKLAEEIRKVLGKGFQVERPESQAEQMEKMVQSYQFMMSFFSTLALLVGLVLVFNSMSIAVAERYKEIGILRALGTTQKNIFWLFLFEALVIGLFGSSLGLGLGRIIANFLVDRVSETMSAQYLTTIRISSLSFSLDDAIKMVFLGTIATIIAAILPAWNAAKIAPLQAMKKNDLSVLTAHSSFLSRYKFHFGILFLIFFSISNYQNVSKYFIIFEVIEPILSILSVLFLGPFFVNFFIRALKPLLLRWGGISSRLAHGNLIRNPRRTGSHIVSLILGLILVILIAVVNMSFKNSILKWFDHTMVADLLVSSQGNLISYQSQPLEEEIGRVIESIPGVKRGPVRGAYGMRFIHASYGGEKVALKAFDEPDPDYLYENLDTRDRPAFAVGKDLFQSEEASLMVSENFVLHFHKKTGDTLDLETPSGLIRFKIVGVFTDFSSDRGVVFMSRKFYKKFWKDSLLNFFAVQVEKNNSVEDLRRAIDEKLEKSKNVTIISYQELRRQMIEIVDRSFATTHAVELAALLVGLLGLMNTLLVSVLERIREIGTLRAVGMSQKQITKMIFTEALIQGSLGALVAVSLGAYLAYFWISFSLSRILGWLIHFYFPWASIGFTLAIGIGLALLAAVFPARKAAQIEITEALDYE